MDSHYSQKSSCPIKTNRSPDDVRVLLADYILNFEYPRDVYLIVSTIIFGYLMLRMLRFSIRLIFAFIKPLIIIAIILLAVPYIHELKPGFKLDRFISSAYSQTQEIARYFGHFVYSAYTNIIRFYAANWSNQK